MSDGRAVTCRHRAVTKAVAHAEHVALDAIASWWVNLHGHAQPRIAAAIAAQAETLEHVIFAGFTHEPAVQLAETLLGAANAAAARDAFARVFFSDNGSTAVEVALKMAFQYHLNRGEGGRRRFLALRGAYQGDTFGAMAVGEPDGFHPQFRCLLPEVDFVTPGDLDGLAERLAGAEVPYAAFIFEPLVQGSAGMKMHTAYFLENAITMCQARGVLAIADEVFTGFFRTGTCFAFAQLAATPDLVCLSKGLTGGFLPLAATLASGPVHAAFLGRDLRQAFLHGHSYTANPLACAAANASWALLQEPVTQARIAAISARTADRIARLRGHSDTIADARCLGTIGAVELGPRTALGDSYFSAHEASVAERAVARGVLLRPLGNVLYAVPPYCVTDGELDRIYDVMEEIIDEI